MLETRKEVETQSLCQTKNFSSDQNILKSFKSKKLDLWGFLYPKRIDVNHTSSPISFPWKKFEEEPMNQKHKAEQISIDICAETDTNSFEKFFRMSGEKIRNLAEKKKNFYIPVKTNYYSPKNRNFADFGLSVNPLHSLEYTEDPMEPYFTVQDEL